jgi:hypothetical protein
MENNQTMFEEFLMMSFVRSFVKSTVALCVLFTVAFAQPKPKAAVYIMGNPEGRDALRAAVNTFLIKSGKYQMIAVDAIDVVALEQKRQMSGSVSDGDIAKLGRDAGAEYVCVVQRTELDGISYVATRMISVQSKVAEFADMVELPPGGKVIELIQWQIGSMLGMSVGPRPSGTQTGTQRSREEILADIQRLEQQKRAEQGGGGATGVTEPPMRGTNVPGSSLGQKLAWLQRSADSHETYIVEVTADESIAPNNTFEYRGAINITIVMRGVGGNRTIRLQSHGAMFIVRDEITFILDNNITLRGHNGNNSPMIRIDGGTFKMNNGTTITGNITSHTGGGVWVGGNGTFEMNGGTISNNTSTSWGGGVIMECCGGPGTFTMRGGTISGNTAYRNGGGIHISNNRKFVMSGGAIVGNTSREYGGGIGANLSFIKTGGIITGYKSDPTNGNAVKDEDGNIIARKGHAVYIDETKRKETTAGPKDNFAKDGSGAWDQ